MELKSDSPKPKVDPAIGTPTSGTHSATPASSVNAYDPVASLRAERAQDLAELKVENSIKKGESKVNSKFNVAEAELNAQTRMQIAKAESKHLPWINYYEGKGPKPATFGSKLKEAASKPFKGMGATWKVAKWGALIGAGGLAVSALSGAKRGAKEAVKEGQDNAMMPMDPQLAAQPMALPPLPVQMPQAMDVGPADGRAPGEWQARVTGAEQNAFVQPAQNVMPDSNVGKLAAKETAAPTLSA